MLGALARRLEAEGFDPFVDREILGPGMSWCQVIHNEMNLCHGAVLLLSKHVVPRDGALDEAGGPIIPSTFVPIEVSVLQHRWSCERGSKRPFLLVPMVIEGADLEQLGRGFWKDVELPENQQLRGVDAAGAEQAVRCVAEILSPLKVSLPTTPLQRVERRITKLLESGDGDANILEAAAAELGPLASAWDRSTKGQAELATLLLRSEIRTVYQALRVLATDFDAVVLEEIYYLVAPSWVDYRAAIRLQQEVGPPARSRGVVLSGRELDFTPRMLVRRADGEVPRLGWPVRAVPHRTADDPRSYYETRVRRALLSIAGIGDEEGTPEALDAKILGYLEGAAEAKSPVFVALSWPGPSLAVLGELQDRYRHVTFLLLTSQSEAMGELAAGRVACLEPPIDPEDERKAKNLDDFIVSRLSG